jgi:hypothetical protein
VFFGVGAAFKRLQVRPVRIQRSIPINKYRFYAWDSASDFCLKLIHPSILFSISVLLRCIRSTRCPIISMSTIAGRGYIRPTIQSRQGTYNSPPSLASGRCTSKTAIVAVAVVIETERAAKAGGKNRSVIKAFILSLDHPYILSYFTLPYPTLPVSSLRQQTRKTRADKTDPDRRLARTQIDDQINIHPHHMDELFAQMKQDNAAGVLCKTQQIRTDFCFPPGFD